MFTRRLSRRRLTVLVASLLAYVLTIPSALAQTCIATDGWASFCLTSASNNKISDLTTGVQTSMLLDLKDGSTQPIDGNFGTGTTNAVKDFQADVGLTQDGQVGANTWSAMRNQLTFQVLEDGWRYYRTASTNGNYPTKGGNTVAFRMNASTLRWQVYSIYTIAGVGCVCNWVQMDSTRTSP